MKHSIYNIVYKKNNHYLIYNTFKCSSIVLDKCAYKKFKKLDFNQNEKDALIRLGIITAKNIDETELFLTKTRMATSNSTNLFFRIYTTLGCNAKCFYCYQKDYEKQTMTKETADLVCDYIINKISEEKTLTLEWFGGEPLCNHKIISYIIEKIKPKLQKMGVVLISKMISNAYLFNNELIQVAKNDWNLKWVQITLDGLNEEYENIKKFGDKSSFNRVISNIKELTKNQINVAIRINYSKQNLEKIFDLLEFLAKEFKNNKYITVYGHAIFGKVNDMNISDNVFLDIEFLRKLYELGLSKDILPNLGVNVSRCMAYALKNALIYPDGTIYKCPQEVGNKQLSIGNVIDNKVNDIIYKWCSPHLPQKCIKCIYLPLCNGGCTFVRRNSEKSCAITKELLNVKLEHNINCFLENKSKYKKI